MSRARHEKNLIALPENLDPVLLSSITALMSLGLVMVGSASIAVADHQYGNSFFYLNRQLVFVLLGLCVMAAMRTVPVKLIERSGPWILLAALLLLITVLIPGLGRSVNGSMRWLPLGLFQLQVSELAKLAVVLYLAGYLVRRGEEVRLHVKGFLKPMVLVVLIAMLLLLEPDLGASAVIMVTVLAMMFLAGVRLWQFLVLLSLCTLAVVILAVAEPYRMRRITSFMDPWADPFDSGFQLTQALIAIGRGEWFGVGLGQSVQKLFYLPEAHTDFLFAVLAEELGLMGGILVIALFGIMAWRMVRVAKRAEALEKLFSAYAVYGIAAWLTIQAATNLAVNMGLLPTKGLTLPMMSYGGSSMLITCAAVGVVLAIDKDCAIAESTAEERRMPEEREDLWAMT